MCVCVCVCVCVRASLQVAGLEEMDEPEDDAEDTDMRVASSEGPDFENCFLTYFALINFSISSRESAGRTKSEGSVASRSPCTTAFPRAAIPSTCSLLHVSRLIDLTCAIVCVCVCVCCVCVCSCSSLSLTYL
jgi:hypothetical protein